MNSGLPAHYRALLGEIYDAIDFKALTLAAMGIRTIIDRFAVEKVGDIGGFETKLKELLARDFISKVDRKYLSVVVNAGSAAAHRGKAFSLDQIAHMMDSVEHLLQSHFVFATPNRELKKATPRRRRH